MTNQLLHKYKERSVTNLNLAEALHVKYMRFSWVRLLCFLGAIAITVLIGSANIWIAIVFVMAFLAGFYRFIKWHQHIKWQEQQHRFLQTINLQEAAALNHQYSDFGDGEEFIDVQHPYTSDFDFFGKYSLFQYFNRTSTTIGKQRLADYLQKNITLEEILARQAAIKDLKDRLDWRQEFRALGMATEDDMTHIRALNYWLESEPFVSNNRLYQMAIKLMPLITLTGLVLWALYLPWFLGILFFVPAGWILKNTVARVNEIHAKTTHAEKILAYYAQLIKHIEKETFESPKLQHLRAAFLDTKMKAHQNKKASQHIARLSYIISQLNVRYNVFALILNLIGLWDLHWVTQLERWQAAHRDSLPKWFHALQEFEAISSLATVLYNNPDWIFPSIHDLPKVEAEQLGHPLIHHSKRVCNDVNIPTKGHIKLLTGSNMAGKSTFLRTVGINIVLAMIGAPVCAKKLSLPMLRVYTSMRTQDALHESTSSFYAELKRLKFIIEAVEKGENIFFLLDEILKGTNSNDRHTGSKALIQQLIKSKGSGIIATHDLELGQLEAQYDGAIENLRIEVQIKDQKLFFDYKVRKGVSESFNATLLMREMGIKV